ncbi:GspE/PulE family protein [Azonexus sp.]|uniref:GspE/PulE family protein n=1 Tax=Azonexus sp. TaxID=1872668 RepID=UPI0039E35D48
MNARWLLGERLLHQGMISSDQLRIALQEQQAETRPLGCLLAELGFADESCVQDVLAEQLAYARFAAATQIPSAQAMALIAEPLARRHHLLPLAVDPVTQTFSLAMAFPEDPQARSAGEAACPPGMRCTVFLAGTDEIAQAISRHYPPPGEIDALLDDCANPAAQAAYPPAEAAPVRLVAAFLQDAVRQGASDVHFAPERACVRIRYRIDGILHTVRLVHLSLWPALAGRLKILAGMNIAENRLAQDGHFSQNILGRQIDFRAACQPTLHGENIVLRILERQRGVLSLEAMQLPAEQLAMLRQMLARPSGLLLVSGPTGSGKTSTLYAMIQAINHEGIHVMTLEDPVEYQLPLLRQVSLTDNAKANFADGVRAVLRQDPDVILIGEIRDAETARMALRAALTGHLVCATLHAGSAFSVFSRLHELGVDLRQLHGNLVGIIAQRLFRTHCACQTQPNATPKACSLCRHSGYRGRRALLEILPVTPALDALLAADASPAQIFSAARAQGFVSLAEAAQAEIARGSTSLEEMARMLDLTQTQTQMLPPEKAADNAL